jgi:DNA-directed RNA polymerase subunit F
MEERTPFEEGMLVTLAEVKSMLTKAQMEREDLTYEQKLALEHSLRFARLSLDKTLELTDELSKLDFLTEPYVYKLVDLCPTEPDDVKAIFAKSKLTIGDAEVKQILDTVLKYYVPE